DTSFYEPDLAITVLDPHRPGHELEYYPGEVCLRTTDVSIINKVDSADQASIDIVENNIKYAKPDSTIIKAQTTITVDQHELVEGRRVRVGEDGATLTQGEMKIGEGIVEAERRGGKEIDDPKTYTVRSLTETFEKYPHIDTVLPAMGYGEEQLKDLEETINNADCDTVIIGTPMDLTRIISINKPTTRVHYELDEVGDTNLEGVLNQFMEDYDLKKTKTK